MDDFYFKIALAGGSLSVELGVDSVALRHTVVYVVGNPGLSRSGPHLMVARSHVG